jgi:hypothetical protein
MTACASISKHLGATNQNPLSLTHALLLPPPSLLLLLPLPVYAVDSLEKQLAFSTALLKEWCGATPVGTSEQVLQQLLST